MADYLPRDERIRQLLLAHVPEWELQSALDLLDSLVASRDAWQALACSLPPILDDLVVQLAMRPAEHPDGLAPTTYPPDSPVPLPPPLDEEDP